MINQFKEDGAMEHSVISDMILRNDLILQGQPKWTFGKNTCNTYEVFVTHFRNQQGYLLPSWPILQIVEKDKALTQLFSIALLWEAARQTVRISDEANSNMTLSLNLLPAFAESDEFVKQVRDCLNETGLQSKHLQFEVSELQDVSPKGCANLNYIHDELGVLLAMGNFGTKNTNMPLLYQVHFDLLELDRSYANVLQNDQAYKTVVGIQHLAETLDMRVCAKGIDTQEQFEFFEEIAIYKGQGALIGPVMDLDELKDYVKRYGLARGHA